MIPYRPRAKKLEHHPNIVLLSVTIVEEKLLRGNGLPYGRLYLAIQADDDQIKNHIN